MKSIILTLSLLFLSVCTIAQLDYELAAKYYFNEGNATDAIGTNHGVINGATPTADRFDNAGHAFLFVDGDYIAIPHSPALKHPNMSVSLWVRIDSVASSSYWFNPIFHVMNNPVNSYMEAFAINVDISYLYYLGMTSDSGAWYNTWDYSIEPASMDWQHIALTMNYDSLVFYVDAVKQWVLPKHYETRFSEDSVYIGATGHQVYTGGLNGAVDDIRVYNRVLTGSEVTELFNEPNPAATGLSASSSLVKALVHPNPARDVITVNAPPNLRDRRIEIMGIDGRIYLSMRLLSPTVRISHLKPGMYVVRVYSRDKLVDSQKLIVE